MKIKICGQSINVILTTEPVIVDGNPAYGYADYQKNEIVIAVMKTTDPFVTFIHETTHMFNMLTNPNVTKDSKFNEEERAQYVANVIAMLLRENGNDLFIKFRQEWDKALKGAL